MSLDNGEVSIIAGLNERMVFKMDVMKNFTQELNNLIIKEEQMQLKNKDDEQKDENRLELLEAFLNQLDIKHQLDSQDLTILVKYLPSSKLIDKHLQACESELLSKGLKLHAHESKKYIKGCYDAIIQTLDEYIDYENTLMINVIPANLTNIMGKGEVTIEKYRQIDFVKKGYKIDFENYSYYCDKAQDFFTEVLPGLQELANKKGKSIDYYHLFLNREIKENMSKKCSYARLPSWDSGILGTIPEELLAFYRLLQESVKRTKADPRMLLEDYVFNHRNLKLKDKLAQKLEAKEVLAKRKI